MGNNILRNKRILVTRPGSQGTDFAAKLQDLGAKTFMMPLLAIVEPDSWQLMDKAIEELSSYDWIIFASSNAVNSFVKRLAAVKCEVSKSKMPKIAAIGEATAHSLKKSGLLVNYQPDNYLAEDFIAQFPSLSNLNGCKILWPRTNIGRELIAEEFRAAGAIVNTVPAYKSELPSNAKDLGKELHRLLQEKQLDVITLASKQTAINLFKIISLNLASSPSPSQELLAQLKNILQDVLIVTIGPETSEGALNYLGKVSIEASPHTADGMIAALVAHYK